MYLVFENITIFLRCESLNHCITCAALTPSCCAHNPESDFMRFVTWVHIKCNHLNYIDYKYLQGCNEPWYCLSCTTMLFPFGNLNNQKFLGFVNNNNDNNNESKNSNSSLILKPPPDLALLFNQFNNAIPENNNDPENVIQSKYYDIDELQQLKIPNKEKSLSLFHINSCSLNKNFEELQNLLQSTNTQFDVIAITETRMKKIPL